MVDLVPSRIVELLDKYIIGQEEAKKSIAIAIRNRYRRMKVKEEYRDEIIPKNILMIGPTGVGKTEIARRVAKIIGAPFVKVEATKYTEVGYVGRDVESMIRDLTEVAFREVQSEKIKNVDKKAHKEAIKRISEILKPYPNSNTSNNPLLSIFTPSIPEEVKRDIDNQRLELIQKIEKGLMDEEYIEIDIEAKPLIEAYFVPGTNITFDQYGIDINELFSSLYPKRTKKKKVKIKEAIELLKVEEAKKLIDYEEVKKEAIWRAENLGIIFIDEIDKIASRGETRGPDVSREGVQRDLLPIIEGTVVLTKYGAVKTDHILFIAAGAFHISKPTDLIPELQGRFPIRVKLKNLNKHDFYKILKNSENSLVKQYKLLLEVENIFVEFTDDAILAIAEIAENLNNTTENIGARRLHAIIEKVVEDLSFNIEEYKNQKVIIDRLFVYDKLKDLIEIEDKSSIYII
ncbi:MAG: ATP-dependent protease ATPase subunit HslU [Candidatus Calescibacterium sp.]|nr:ATP-dependent protease ATPase subunit HslU [Candidatus Calescibacterium sp.]MCX7972481.1 ATP-dependent protease ATPase subunit HslU [bacterium]MDW8195627.1 ATP-dependent protease ATPase subunit HslU [Candidatus Calescibacterium sp.]